MSVPLWMRDAMSNESDVTEGLLLILSLMPMETLVTYLDNAVTYHGMSMATAREIAHQYDKQFNTDLTLFVEGASE